MTTRERRLATIVGAVAAVGVAVKVVYPLTIRPLFDVEDEIVRLEGELADLEQERDRVDDILLEYKRLVERTGDVDPAKVRNRLQEQLEEMLRRAGLESPHTQITPKPPMRDRKTGISTVPLGITAEGGLQQIIEFLEKCYELSYVARFKDIKLAPAAVKRGKTTESDRVKLTATFEALTLPQAPQAAEVIDFGSLPQPVEQVKHNTGADYAMIWERQPFNEYAKSKPSPPTEPRKLEKQTLTPPKDRPEPPPRLGDRDRGDKYVAGVLRYGVDELMIKNEKRKTQEYIAKGKELDGGTLLYVHPYGGIVRKEEGDYFYAVGKLLSEAVPVEEAKDYPEIQAVGVQLAKAMPNKRVVPLEETEVGGFGGNDSEAQVLPDADEPGADEAVDEEAGGGEVVPAAPTTRPSAAAKKSQSAPAKNKAIASRINPPKNRPAKSGGRR